MAEENMTMEQFAKEVDASFETFQDEDQLAWETLKKYQEEKTALTVTVEGIANKGVIASVEGIRGFIPASRLALGRVEDLNAYLGQEIEVQVREIDPEKNRLILSAKELLRAKADQEKKARISAVEVGSVMEGTVESLKPYGAFVALGEGMTGLVHVSQISHTRIKDPSVVLKEDKAKAEEDEIRSIKIPKAEALTTNLGDLFKNIKL